MSYLEKYDSLKGEFQNQGLLKTIKGAEEKIQWPEGSGVYVIWKNNRDDAGNLIYVGMTGKFKRKNGILKFNNGTFKSRATRWTPYRFCESTKDVERKYQFRYGPKSSSGKEQDRIKYEDEAYSSSIAYNDIIIDCFIVNEDHDTYSPILLESLILTSYLKEFNNLPPANNEL